MTYDYTEFSATPLLTMYDAANADGIPPNAQYIAGYLDGGDYNTLRARFPRAKVLGIATHGSVDGDCLDVEGGDATPADVVPWLERQLRRGVYRPCVYSSLWNGMPAVQAALEHVPRAHYRLWVAHWQQASPDFVPSGYDAIQWRSTSMFDESLCLPDFFGAPPAPRTPTLTALQRGELGSMYEHLAAIRVGPAHLSVNELGELKVMQAHLAAITKGY